MRNRTRTIAGICAALLLAVALWHLLAEKRGLRVERTVVDGTPATVIFDPAAPPGPAVLIAHGFAGSQQLMLPFATTLARSGYVAVTYDMLGHARNPRPLGGDVAQVEGATRALLGQMARMAAFASALPQSDGRLALLGHSMASDIVVRQAIADPEIAATVAVSMFSPVVTATEPRNLLVVTGALEAGLTDEALRVAGLAAGGTAAPFVTYGDPAAGTGRRVALSPHVEHVGVLYSATSLTEARDWLNATFGRTVRGAPDARGVWVLAWFLGAATLAWALSARLPRLAPAAPPARPSRRRAFWIAALAPAVATPALAVLTPRGLLPVPVADYLSVHFLLYGALTALALRALRWTWPARPPLRPLLGAALAYAGFALVVIYLPVDRFVTSFDPTGGRAALLLTLLVGLAPYFLADEALARGPDAPRGAYPATKLAFLASLALAIALATERLFFLVLILPVMLAFFLLFGLFSRWSFRATGSPWPAALANALLFSWAIATTFPILAR
jgi:predicted alpha/beta-hydrolase family hydrolase